MEIFKSVRKDLVFAGFDTNKRPFHRKQLLNVVKGFLAIILDFLYLVYDANTVREYINCILMAIIGVAVFTSYLSAIFETTTIYDFINGYETLINRSKHSKFNANFSLSIYYL